MKKLIMIIIIIILASCSGGTDTVYVPSNNNNNNNDNHTDSYYKTLNMAGNWHLYYWITNRWDDYYYFNPDTIFKVSGYDDLWSLGGSDEFGDLAVAGYNPTEKVWTILCVGTTIDQFYMFYISNGNIDSGCYYLISHPSENISPCFELYGGIVKTSSTLRSLILEEKEIPEIENLIPFEEAEESVIEAYYKLKNMTE